MKVYISGPMSYRPDSNRNHFDRAAAILRTMGFDVVNPSEMDRESPKHGWSWSDYLRRDLKVLVECDAVALLPEWNTSRGARLEVEVAHALGMPTVPAYNFEALATLLPKMEEESES